MSNTINQGGFDWEQQEDGTWIWKASKNKQIPNLQSKPKYKDAPRYPVIYKYENEWKQRYENMLQDTIKELTKKMYKFVKNGDK